MSFDVESVASQAAQQYEQAYHTHETLRGTAKPSHRVGTGPNLRRQHGEIYY